MAQKVNPANLLSLDALFSTEDERNRNKADNAEETEPRQAGKNHKKGETDTFSSQKATALEHQSEQTVKKTFFLTQKNYDALKLHHMMYASTAREYSKIINEALELYLSNEIDALAVAETKTTGSRKFVLALSMLSEQLVKEQ